MSVLVEPIDENAWRTLPVPSYSDRGKISKCEIQEEIQRLRIWTTIALPGRRSQSRKVSPKCFKSYMCVMRRGALSAVYFRFAMHNL